MAGGYQLNLRVVVLVIAVSAPLALGVETLLRTFVISPMAGPVFNEARVFFSPQTTAFAWGLTGVCVLAGIVGLAVLRRTSRGLLGAGNKKGNAGGKTGEAHVAELRDKLFLLTSIPQAPAVLATLCFTLGARLAPVLVCMGISTAFVLAMGYAAARALGEAGLSELDGG